MCSDNLQPGLMYKVTKSSSDGKIVEGNIVEVDKKGVLIVLEDSSGVHSKCFGKEQWHRPEQYDFCVEVWNDPALISEIKTHIPDDLDIDQIIIEYTQVAMITASSSMNQAVKNLQIAQWLKELKQLRIDVCILPNDL